MIHGTLVRMLRRKINTVAEVESMYTVGDRFSIFDTPFGKIGVSVCADNLINSLSIPETLARMGAKVIYKPLLSYLVVGRTMVIIVEI